MAEVHRHSKCSKLYIFGKRKTSSFQKYIVFHGCYNDIHRAVFSISPIFPIFLSMLVPFSLIRNHIFPEFFCGKTNVFPANIFFSNSGSHSLCVLVFYKNHDDSHQNQMTFDMQNGRCHNSSHILELSPFQSWLNLQWSWIKLTLN